MKHRVILLIVSFISVYVVGKQTLFPILSVQGYINPSTINGDFTTDQSYTYDNVTAVLPSSLAFNESNYKNSKVLGESASSKRIEVDLTNQRLYAYEGDRQIYDFLISSGKWGKTPTGVFQIWGKFRYVKMEGGSQALHTYYNLPNVPFTMFFYNEAIPKYLGFGLHGTYWHSNFGHPMSHGCINMKTEEAGLIYYWAQPDLSDKKSILATDTNPGTQIIIYGTAPQT